jgi:hypothetical protein
MVFGSSVRCAAVTRRGTNYVKAFEIGDSCNFVTNKTCRNYLGRGWPPASPRRWPSLGPPFAKTSGPFFRKTYDGIRKIRAPSIYLGLCRHPRCDACHRMGDSATLCTGAIRKDVAALRRALAPARRRREMLFCPLPHHSARASQTSVSAPCWLLPRHVCAIPLPRRVSCAPAQRAPAPASGIARYNSV